MALPLQALGTPLFLSSSPVVSLCSSGGWALMQQFLGQLLAHCYFMLRLAAPARAHLALIGWVVQAYAQGAGTA